MDCALRGTPVRLGPPMPQLSCVLQGSIVLVGRVRVRTARQGGLALHQGWPRRVVVERALRGTSAPSAGPCCAVVGVFHVTVSSLLWGTVPYVCPPPRFFVALPCIYNTRSAQHTSDVIFSGSLCVCWTSPPNPSNLHPPPCRHHPSSPCTLPILLHRQLQRDTGHVPEGLLLSDGCSQLYAVCAGALWGCRPPPLVRVQWSV